MSTRLFVSVGTDHHPFGRLISWVDDWVASHPQASLIVQHGSSPRSSQGENQSMMTAEDIRMHYELADIVVSQVGPGTIADANAAGHVPLVVPRDPAQGEVVDDHQYLFGRFMADRGRCVMVTTREELHAALEQASSSPEPMRFDPGTSDADPSAAVGALAARLVSSPRRRLRWRRVRDMLASHPDRIGRDDA